LVVDGQQRLQTLRYFYDGIFEPTGRKFTLNLTDKSGKNPWQSEYHGSAYTDLKAADQLRLDDSILHATIIRQDEPDEDVSSAVFDIFERLNTETDELRPQEIRTCVYWGEFSEFLSALNALGSWRNLLGRPDPDKRMRDQELLLRFFALFYEADDYTKPMKRFLNSFMKSNRHMEQYDAETLRGLLESTVEVALGEIGTDGFKRGRNFNAAIFDSVFVGIARRLTAGHIQDGEGLRIAYKSLVANSEYDNAVSVATSDEDSVSKRLRLATQAFEGVV
jgi:hypothetical protein